MGTDILQRQLTIVNLLNEHDKLNVKQIAEHIQVSTVTIRKDLQILEDKGLLRRFHGYALRVSHDDINSRLSYAYETKQRIAKRALAFLEPGETVMIESGSTCALLAMEIATAAKDITIITNSAFIAGYIRHIPSAKTILLGGDYQNDAQVMVGPITEMCAKEYHVDKLFTGIDGYTTTHGFSQENHTRARTVKTISKNADKIFVLSDSSKFGTHSVARLFEAKEVHTVITDDAIPSELKADLQSKNVRVVCA